jgi:pimeloyl-ACP methyl ester carboxylesterase
VRQTGELFAKVGELDICYDEIGPEDGEPMLMVMGLATQMIGWHEEFCALLAERGYRVIRFDNRDIGRSTWFDEAGVPGRTQMLFGTGKPAYRLADMAEDAGGLLAGLDIESAHVVGASQGGMIAQQLAISYPGRVRSLASIMSTPGGRWNGTPAPRAMRALLARPEREREAMIERAVATFRVIGSPGFELDEDHLRSAAGLSFDRGHHPAGVARQLHAVTSSPNRTQALRRLHVPTVVIHGDRDPLVRPVAGRATARAVPDSRLVMIRGMGHDLPREAWPQIVEAIAGNAARSVSSGAAAEAALSGGAR